MLKSESSSDRFLIDIQIEESLSRETLMSIDSSNKKEDCITFLFIVFLLFITTVVGIYGPPVQMSFNVVYTFLKNERTVSFPFGGLSKFNHFIQLKISLLKKRSLSQTFKAIPLTIKAFMYEQNNLINTDLIKIDNFPIYYRNSNNWTNPEIVFTDRLIKYDKLKITISFGQEFNENFSKCLAIWTLGNPEQPLIQMWFRGIYSLACLISLILFLSRLIKTPFKIWHLEQKLTAFLVLLAFLADDPLYFNQKLEVKKVGVIIDIISISLFRTYLQFFVLTLFDSLRYKNRKIGRCFFAPKILFFFLLLITEILHSFIDDSQTTIFIEKFTPQIKILIHILHQINNAFYIFWMIVAIVSAGAFIDITEKYKFSVYSNVSIICISVIMFVDFVLKPRRIFQDTSLSFAIHFTVQNLFVLLMVVFHWPYETLTDQQYHDTGEGVSENDFFVK